MVEAGDGQVLSKVTRVQNEPNLPKLGERFGGDQQQRLLRSAVILRVSPVVAIDAALRNKNLLNWRFRNPSGRPIHLNHHTSHIRNVLPNYQQPRKLSFTLHDATQTGSR